VDWVEEKRRVRPSFWPFCRHRRTADCRRGENAAQGSMLDDEGDAGQLAPPPGGTGIMVGHIWRQAPTRGAPGGGHKLQRFGPRASDGPDASAGIQMITADDFLVACRTRNIDFFTGVPCSFLTPLINRRSASRASTMWERPARARASRSPPARGLPGATPS